MKKVMWLCKIFLLLFIVSCSKNQSTSESSSDGLSALTKEVISQSSPISMRQSYAMLSVQEKETLWKTKYKTILLNDAKRMTSEQLRIVNKLNDFLLANGMEKLSKNSEMGDAFLKANIENFGKHFTREQLYMLIECAYFKNDFSILNAERYLKDLMTTNKVAGEIGEIEPVGDLAGNCTCYYSISCGVGKSCNDGTCTRGPKQCGLWGNSNCTGTCG